MKTNLQILKEYVYQACQTSVGYITITDPCVYSSEIELFHQWLVLNKIPVEYQKANAYATYGFFLTDTNKVELRYTGLKPNNALDFIAVIRDIMTNCKFDRPYTYKFNIGEEVQMLVGIPNSHSCSPPGGTITSIDYGSTKITERQLVNGEPWYKLEGYGNWCKENSLEAVVKKEIPKVIKTEEQPIFKIGDRVMNIQEDVDNSCLSYYKYGDAGIIQENSNCPNIQWDNGKIAPQYTKYLQLVPHELSDIQPFTTPSTSTYDSADALVHSNYISAIDPVVATPQPKNDILEGPVLITKKSKKKGKLMSL